MSYNYVSTGFSDPELTLSTGKETILRYGVHYQPKSELPFDTVGEWDIDKLNFDLVENFKGREPPISYKSKLLISDSAVLEMPAGTVEVIDDCCVDGPSLETIECAWAKGEITLIEEQIACHSNGCPDANHTESECKAYWVSLRAHIKNNGAFEDRPPKPE